MATPRFDLVDIAKALKKRARFILIVTIAAAITGAVFYLVSEKKYQGRAEFFVSNPLYSDRNNVFRTFESQFIDYFGDEDDIDKVLAIAKSEVVRARVIETLDLGKVYKLDTSNVKDMIKLTNRFKKSYDFKRSEYQNVEISYTDTDPQIAANVANGTVRVIEEVYRGYYNNIRQNVYNSLQDKVKQTDSSIASLTDTLARLRDRYHIYDIISPSRQNIVNGSIQSNGAADFGRGVEEVQNLESMKDQVVKDRASYLSLMNEFSTGTKMGQMPLLSVISPAMPATTPQGLGLPLLIVACALVGFFFSAVWVLFSAYFRTLTSVER
jgi:uncharacterized protein involved in exopolysaccharide biosynthesis